MNNLKAEYNLEAASLTLKVEVEVIPKVGIDLNGTYQKASWGNAAQALAIFLDGLEASQEELIDAINASNGEPLDDTDNNDKEANED